ncbi:Phospholipase D/Transphosphatidylase [Erythrobacter sp. NAP1]|uniref:phospholipase D-like domain-containing protein n=1 Tax=Erythrobacter sp. NAP1 TaxID=237727 RepID=UPI0000687867|nr:cardiolipin synthase B [Erythrobacter sp. NAP1]EAQ28185.1 Phospholipase D/Transphosphatidylase [Erythrobacter sp. NAP1]
MARENPPDPLDKECVDYCDPDPFEVSAQGHDFTFYPRGKDRLKNLLDLIANARETLDVFYYMFQDDVSGTKVRDALAEASGRGVKVALIVDDFGSDAPPSFFEPIVEAGGDFAIFSADWNVRYLVRNHQKFAIADNARVMTGGSNVSDHYFAVPADNGWCDLGVLIEGPLAEQFTKWFKLLKDWTESDGSQFRRVRKMIRDWDPGDGSVQLLVGGPLIRRSHWSYAFKKDLRKASRLDLVTAYFGPPRSFRRAIAKVAKRGKARLITAGKSDLEGTIAVARLFYKRLLKAGASIFEFQPCKLHMKLLVVDDKSYFGSANLDRRSVRINIELMIRVEDEALAQRLREFIDGLQEATILADKQWYRENSSLLERVRWRLYHWLSLVDYRAGRMAAST